MATVTITLGAGGVPDGWTVSVSTRDTQPTFSSGTGDIESVQFTALPIQTWLKKKLFWLS